jgi:hypothetical protein
LDEVDIGRAMDVQIEDSRRMLITLEKLCQLRERQWLRTLPAIE